MSVRHSTSVLSNDPRSLTAVVVGEETLSRRHRHVCGVQVLAAAILLLSICWPAAANAVSGCALPAAADGAGYTTAYAVRAASPAATRFLEVRDVAVPEAIDARKLEPEGMKILYSTITGLPLEDRACGRTVRSLRALQARSGSSSVPTTQAVGVAFVLQAAGGGAGVGVAVEALYLIQDGMNGNLAWPYCYSITKRLYTAAVFGAITGAAFAVYPAATINAATAKELSSHPVARLFEKAGDALGNETDLLFPDFVKRIGETLGSDYVAQGVCSIGLGMYWLFHDKAESEQLAQDVVDGIEQQLTNFAVAASGSGDPIQSAGVSLVDSSGVTRGVYRSDESPTASGEIHAMMAGTYAIDVVAVANSTHSFVVSSTTVAMAGAGRAAFNATFSCQRVVNWFGGTSGDFTIYPVITAPNGNVWHPGNLSQIRKGTVRIVDKLAAHPPTVTFSAQSSGGALLLDVVYSDVDGDRPTALTVSVNGVQYPALPYEETTSRGFERRYSVNASLIAGIYTVAISTSDGLTPINLTQQVRHSPNPPRVALSAAPTSVAAGTSTSISATLVDDVGGLSGETIRFSTNGSGAFGGGIANTTRSLTNSSGVATKSFTPSSSGTHTLTAQWGPSESASTTLSVTSGGAGLSTEWNFSRVSSNDTEATYDVSVRITNNGTPVTYLQGADVTIAVNHGRASETQDSPSSDGVITFYYNLTAAEAASGDEIFTLHVDIYDATLVYGTNLLVGATPTFSYIRQTALNGSGSGDSLSQAVALSPNGQYLGYVTSDSAIVVRWSDLSVVSSYYDSNNRPTGIAFSPDSSKIAVGDNRGGVTVMEIASGAKSRKVMTTSSADIVNIHWYAADRMALATIGVYSTSGSTFAGRVIIADSLLNQISSTLFPSLTLGRDVDRVTCHPTNGLCAVASDESTWFVMYASGGVFAGPYTHPDGNDILALAFNAAGTVLFVGGYDNNGSRYAKVYDVTGSGLTYRGAPATLNNDVHSARFVMEGGQERLVVAGSNAVEVYSNYTGLPDRSATGLGTYGELGHSLQFASTGILAEMNQTNQVFFNFSGDYTGPSASIPGVEVPYRQTSANLVGRITDPSGIAAAEWSRNGGTATPLMLSDAGDFSVDLAQLPVGTTTVSIHSVDIVWNASTTDVVVTRRDDLAGPTIRDVTFSPGIASRTTTLQLACTITDEDSAVASAEISVTRGGATIKRVALAAGASNRYTASFDLSDVTAPPGLYSIDIAASDTSPSANVRVVRGAAGFQLIEPVDPPAVVTATATTYTAVNVSWAQGGGATNYELYRNSGSGYQLIATPTGTAYTDTVLPGKSYMYRLRSRAADGRVSVDSVADIATTVFFTDETITRGVTTVKAIHWTEVRSAVDMVRELAGFSPATYSTTPRIGAAIGAAEVLETRAAIAAARSTLGLPPPSFTDGTLTAGSSVISAAHLSDLRNAVK